MDNEEKLIVRAKAYENTTQPKSIMVENFGSEDQKNRFNKDNGWKDSKREKPFITTLKQYFESVESVKVKGIRAKQYKLGKARNQVAKREDNRVNNSGVEIPYTKYLDALILMALNNRMFEGRHETTLNNWVYHFGLVNQALFILKTSPRSKESIDIRNQLKDNELSTSLLPKAETDTFIEDYENTKKTLKRTLERLAKENLIEFYKVPKAVIRTGEFYVDEDGRMKAKKELITLDTECASRIADKKAKLREKYGVTEYEVLRGIRNDKEKANKIKEYQIELDDYFMSEVYIETKEGVKHVHVEYNFFNYAVYIKATKTRIKNYIKKKRPEFYDEFITDEDLFFQNVRQSFDTERRVRLLNEAYKKAQLEYEKLLSKQMGFGEEADAKRERYLHYWQNDFCENVGKLEPKLKADHNQSLNKRTLYKKWEN